MSNTFIPAVDSQDGFNTDRRVSADRSSTRVRCFGCFRPATECYCDSIPSIDNRTEILVVQHARERDHPFNTARMVRRGLNNSRLICGSNAALAGTDLKLQPRAGLLYPSNGARDISEIPAHQMPEQLVIIDGTWSQAKTIFRDLPQLQRIPCFKLTPSQPSQYRIRLEPTDTSLSTVEAAVHALQLIEPDTGGLDILLTAFEAMVQRQLNHPHVGRENYSGGPKSGRTVNVPKALLGDPSKIVVAYGESAYRDPFQSDDRDDINPRPPLFWIAQRLGTGEVFAQAIRPDVEMTPSFLNHLELTERQFKDAVSIDAFRIAWRQFVCEGDVLGVYNQGTIGLLDNVGADFVKSTTLKSINFDEQKKNRTLCEFIQSRQLARQPSLPEHGRAGRRLANAVALVNRLRSPAAR